MTIRAAALAIALSLAASPAFAGAPRRFSLGAVVVASATVSAWAGGTAREGARLQVQGRGAPRPMVLVPGGMRPLPDSGVANLGAPLGKDLVVTILY